MLDFANTMTADLARLSKKWIRVRIHDSGDFFSEEYLLTWYTIARLSPQLQFYSYTKRIALLASTRHHMPDNMHLVQSVGGKEDALIDRSKAHAIIFPSEAALQEAGYVNGTHTDRPAYERIVKIGLAYHGVRKLTTENAALLARRV
jgi:hypothetical protein